MTLRFYLPFKSLCLASVIGVASLSTPALADDTYCGVDGSKLVAQDLDGF